MPAFDPAKTSGLNFPKCKSKALWDTGATSSSITKAIADKLGLQPTGIEKVRHAGGTSNAYTYIINLELPNRVGIVGLRVIELTPQDDFDVIVGMDVIAQGAFAITDKNSKTCASYCIPSMGSIDFVVDANRSNLRGIGRNDPCPCGKKDKSGKPVKFKHCCGKKKFS